MRIKQDFELFKVTNGWQTVDLGTYAYQNQWISEKGFSLRELCFAVLGFTLDKTYQKNVDWGRKTLRKEEAEYAALDALAGLRIYLAIASGLPQSHVSYYFFQNISKKIFLFKKIYQKRSFNATKWNLFSR